MLTDITSAAQGSHVKEPAVSNLAAAGKVVLFSFLEVVVGVVQLASHTAGSARASSANLHFEQTVGGG